MRILKVAFPALFLLALGACATTPVDVSEPTATVVQTQVPTKVAQATRKPTGVATVARRTVTVEVKKTATERATAIAEASPTSKPTSIALETPTAASSVVAEETALPTVIAEATPVNTDTLAIDLQNRLSAKLPGTPTPDAEGTSFGGITGAWAFRVRDGEVPLYAAHTFGFRTFDPDQNHYLAIYERRNSGWNEVARVDLDLPDFLDPGNVRQVEIDSASVWLEIEGSAGAHSGTYNIFRYGAENGLVAEVSHSSASPGAGFKQDVDGDGKLEVVLNMSEAYVFCYACGVRYINFEVLRWNGDKMERVALKKIVSGAFASVREANNRAVDMANGDLLKDALPEIEKAVAVAPEDETVRWNAALIKLLHDARKPSQEFVSYPLIENVFYGDYDAAISAFRPLSTEEIFSPQSPLIVGTPAENWQEELSSWIGRVTEGALKVDKERAGAYFLRGWARWLKKPESADAIKDFQKASELAPGDELFTNVLAYVTNR